VTAEVAYLLRFTSMLLPLYLDVKGELGHATIGNEEEHLRTIELPSQGGTHDAAAAK
jgi:hypothetical protein